jgi:hypothetical protein
VLEEWLERCHISQRKASTRASKNDMKLLWKQLSSLLWRWRGSIQTAHMNLCINCYWKGSPPQW